MNRTVIVGGGVIGLSLAWELVRRNDQTLDKREVIVLDRATFGSKASRAGAGILLPANLETAIHPIDQLEAISNDLHESWSEELKAETGIDNGFRKCGGLYVARTAGEVALLAGSIEYWRQREIEFEPLSVDQSKERFPFLAPSREQYGNFKAVFIASEYQFRNPDHLTALKTACLQRGVQLYDQVGELTIETQSDKVVAIKSQSESWTGDQFCLTAGPWTASLCKDVGFDLPMQPVKGHMVLYRLPNQTFEPIVNEGSRYLVPRDDGHVLAGSTIEETDFDETLDPQEIGGLKDWARSLIPDLDDNRVLDSWTGLRPGTFDAMPYMGRLPGFSNTFVSTGHFKAGLQLSPGCAVAMADLMGGKQSAVDMTPFEVSRVNDAFYRMSTENK